MEKTLVPILGIFLAIVGFTWLQGDSPQAASAREAINQHIPAGAAPASAATTPESTPPTTHLPAVTPKKGMTAKDIGLIGRDDMKIPDDCQDPKVTGLQNMVKYVNDHSNPSATGFVTNEDAPGYFCGWN